MKFLAPVLAYVVALNSVVRAQITHSNCIHELKESGPGMETTHDFLQETDLS